MPDTCQTCGGSGSIKGTSYDHPHVKASWNCPDCKPPEPKDCPACGASNASVCAHHENERPEGCINTDEVIGGRIARIAKPTEGGERYVVKGRPRDRGDCDYCVFDNLLMLPVLRGIDIKSAAQISANTFNALEAQHTQSLLAAERERVVSVVEINGAIQDYISNSGDAVPGSLLKLLSDLDWSLTQQEATNE